MRPNADSKATTPSINLEPPQPYNQTNPQVLLKKSQKTPKQQCLINSQPNIDIYSNIGVLLSLWVGKNNKVKAKNIGTAFAITPRLVLTCTHNVYTEMLKSHADEVVFYPGVKNAEEIGEKAQSYEGRLLNRERTFQNVSFMIGPVKEQLTLILLDSDIKGTTKFPKIGNFSTISNINTWKLRVVGYPSTVKARKGLYSPFLSLDPRRRDENGSIFSFKDHEIKYEIKTVKGQSGGPVLAIGPDNEQMVVGIHTHAGGAGQKSNLGLYFSNQILQTIKYEESKLKVEYPQLIPIKYKRQDSLLSIEQQQVLSKDSSKQSKRYDQKIDIVQQQQKCQLIPLKIIKEPIEICQEEKKQQKSEESQKVSEYEREEDIQSQTYSNKSVMINDYITFKDDDSNHSSISIFDDMLGPSIRKGSLDSDELQVPNLREVQLRQNNSDNSEY